MRDAVIAVTGAFGTLGATLIEELARRGALPVAIDVAAEGESAHAALVVPGCDIATADGAGRAIGRIEQRFGRLDGLANVAGGFRWAKIGDGDADEWEALYRMNLSTALNMSRAALPLLRASRGAIVNIGAAAADRATLGMGAYAASKAAVARFTEALAAELAGDGIRVNAVLPTIIDTPANRADMPDADRSGWVAPADLARMIAFLLSDEVPALSGAAIRVSNGR